MVRGGGRPVLLYCIILVMLDRFPERIDVIPLQRKILHVTAGFELHLMFFGFLIYMVVGMIKPLEQRCSNISQLGPHLMRKISDSL